MSYRAALRLSPRRCVTISFETLSPKTAFRRCGPLLGLISNPYCTMQKWACATHWASRVFCDYRDKAERHDCSSMPKDAITLPFVSFFFIVAMVNLSPWCLITSKQQLVNILGRWHAAKKDDYGRQWDCFSFSNFLSTSKPGYGCS